MDKDFFEDYTVGEKHVTPGRTITETDIGMFAGLTGDWHELHTNVEFAKKTPFGERIAHGMMVLAVGSALALRLGKYVTLPKSFIAFYGMDSVRFIHPTMIGDTITLEFEVIELTEKDEKSGIITAKNTIKNQKGNESCVYISKILAGRRPK